MVKVLCSWEAEAEEWGVHLQLCEKLKAKSALTVWHHLKTKIPSTLPKTKQANEKQEKKETQFTLLCCPKDIDTQFSILFFNWQVRYVCEVQHDILMFVHCVCLYCEVAYLIPESPVLIYLLLFVYMCVVYVPWLLCGDQRVTCVGSRPLLLSYGTWRSKIKLKIVMLDSKPLYPLNHLTGPHTYHFRVCVVRTRRVYSQQFKKDEFVVRACTRQSSVWLEDSLQELFFFHQVSSRDQTQIKAGQGEP